MFGREAEGKAGEGKKNVKKEKGGKKKI